MMNIYQDIVKKNIGILKEIDEIDKIRNKVMSQLGIDGDNSRLRAALIFQWLFRLYAQKMGEAHTIKIVRKMVKGII